MTAVRRESCGTAVRTCLVLFGAMIAPVAAAEPPVAEVDLGLFARVVTSDPARVEGTKAQRLDEFPAGDLFLTTEMLPRGDGAYAVSRGKDGRSAIGLEWAERRVLREAALEFIAPAAIPAEVQVQFWSSSGREDSWAGIGQTPWQGRWERLPATVRRDGRRLIAQISADTVPEFRSGVGVLKIRWVFTPGDAACVVRRPVAFGPSVWQADTLLLEADAAGEVVIESYNGLLTDPGGGNRRTRAIWHADKPLRLGVVYSRPSPRKADRTLLRLHFPQGLVTVAVEDALTSPGVRLRDFAARVRRADVATLAIPAPGQTVLARVRNMPDQTFAQAMQALWRPIQNNGPTMLSLACDNEKFIVDRDGGVRYGRLSVKPQWGAGPIELRRMDFGEIGLDTAVRPVGAAKALPLRIGEKKYAKGIGLHANAELCIALDGRYDLFEAELGVLPEAKPGGTLAFQIDIDGQQRFDSGVMRAETPPKPLRLKLAGAKQLTIRVSDAGDGILNDAACLGNARLVPSQAGAAPLYLSDLYAQQLKSPAQRSRQLEGRWLPILVNGTQGNTGSQGSQGGQGTLRQRTWVAPIALAAAADLWSTVGKARSVGVVELTLDNPSDRPTKVDFRLGITPAPVVQSSGTRHVWSDGNRVCAVVDTADAADAASAASLSITPSPGGIAVTGALPAKSHRRLVAYLPAWPATVAELAALPSPAQLHQNTVDYWQAMLRDAMQLHLPEPLLEDVYRATQVHCLMAARNEQAGRLVAPWCASDAYGPLDTEAQPVILGMALSGQGEFARRGLDFFIHSYNADGLLVKGYTLIGTGQHLWTLAECYARRPDRAWLTTIAPEVLKSCRWILRQTEKTKRRDPRGAPLPEFGLAPPGVLADWDRYAYYFYANGQYAAGLDAALGMVAETLPAEAEKLRGRVSEYRENVLRAFRWQRSRMPVVPLGDGTWVAPCPSSLYCYGLTREFFGGVSATGHDVEAGGNHLLPLGLLPPSGPEADAIVDYLEDRWFLIDGIFGAYPAAENERDWFHRGGFAKLQPHYTRTAEMHALRDDVKPFVRTYFNMFPVLLNRENLSFWEHMNNGGAWNKTHESGWFLHMTRTMLLTERGDALWLAPFVTDRWLESGRVVSVQNAPTRFGPAGYTIRSSVDRGVIEATVVSPMRTPPAQIVLRLRHPQGKAIRRTTVDGLQWRAFDAAGLVRLVPRPTPMAVRVFYQ